MCKKSKEFESESFSYCSSFFKLNNSNFPSEWPSLDLVKMEISNENLKDNNYENNNYENNNNENNNNVNNNNVNNSNENFNILDDNQNNNYYNNLNLENEISKNNFGNIQNLETQNMKILNQKIINKPQQSTTKKSTGEATQINIIYKESPEKIEKEKEEKKIHNNKNGDKEYKIRNLYPKYFKKFFKDLVIYINRLIEEFNLNNHTNISSLELINGEKYYHHNFKNQLYLLDRTVMEALSTRVEFIEDEDKKLEKKIEELKNKDICNSIYNEKDEKKRINKVIKIFKKTIRELMKVYNEEKHEDELYKYFNTFWEFVKTVDENEKKILTEIAQNYESIIIKKINDNEHKRGPKPKTKKK